MFQNITCQVVWVAFEPADKCLIQWRPWCCHARRRSSAATLRLSRQHLNVLLSCPQEQYLEAPNLAWARLSQIRNPASLPPIQRIPRVGPSPWFPSLPPRFRTRRRLPVRSACTHNSRGMIGANRAAYVELDLRFSISYKAFVRSGKERNENKGRLQVGRI